MNFGGLLNIARSGLATSQAQIAVTSQNITNAQTPGYSRQRLRIEASTPQVLPQGIFGTGVQSDGAERMRNELMDWTFRRDAQGASLAGERRDALQAVENILGEPSNTGLASSFEQLWSSWSDLSTNPNSSAARGVVRQRASQVAAQLNQFGNQITDAETVMRARLTEKVDRVNALASQVADINERIVAAESSGNESPDMRDQRDAKIDELASLIGASAYPQADGSVNVNIGGDSLVDGANFKSVRLQGQLSDPTRLGIALGELPPSGDPTETMYNLGGAVSGMLDGYNTVFPNALTALDGVARALVTNTNALHRTGFIGTTAAGDFFDATRTTARTIRLDAAIETDVSRIASSGAPGQNGDNTVALALSQLRSTPVTVDGLPVTATNPSASISERYRTVAARVAANVSAANGTADAMRTLTSQSDARRESIKGVSLDEEMVNLMKFQQSYAAAARLIAVVDELSQTLINMGR